MREQSTSRSILSKSSSIRKTWSTFSGSGINPGYLGRFQKRGDATFLVDELKQVFDPQGGYFKKGGRFMPSLVAEIGDVLDRHMRRIGLITEEELSEAHVALINEKREAATQKQRKTRRQAILQALSFAKNASLPPLS